MSTSLCWTPHAQPGPFSAFVATCKYPYSHGDFRQPNVRIAVNGDPFFFTLNSLRQAINRLSSQRYPLHLDFDTMSVGYGARYSAATGINEKYRALTFDDFLIELVTYTPTHHPFDLTLPGKTTPSQILGVRNS